MILLLALIPATGLTMAGYVVLYVSTRNQGALSTFGRWLAFWAFTLAALVVLGGVFAAGHMHHGGPHGFWGRHHEWSEERPDFDRERAEPPAASPPAPASAPPAAAPSAPK